MPSMPRAVALALALTLALVVGACGAGASGSPAASTPSDPQASGGASASATPTATATATATPTEASTPIPTPTATPSASPAPTAAASPVYESPEDLAVGDCYDPIEDEDDGWLLAVIVKPCEEPHLAEVFAVTVLPGGPDAPYPGADDADDASEDLCDAAFETYVGIDFDRSRYGYIYYAPSEETWADGDRALMCALEDGSRPTEGSARGSRE